MQIEGARRKEHGSFYVGKRCVYVYKAETKKCVPQHPERKTRVRAVWGKVTRIHGNTGAVRARFNRNLPGHAMGHRIRIVSSNTPSLSDNWVVLTCLLSSCRCCTHQGFKLISDLNY